MHQGGGGIWRVFREMTVIYIFLPPLFCRCQGEIITLTAAAVSIACTAAAACFAGPYKGRKYDGRERESLQGGERKLAENPCGPLSLSVIVTVLWESIPYIRTHTAPPPLSPSAKLYR